MKRLMLACMALMVCFLAQAQLKVYPKLNVGDKYVYGTTTTTDNEQFKLTANSTVQYTVTEKTHDGYIIDVMTTELKSDSDNDLMSMTMTILQGMLKGVNIRVKVNKLGQPQSIPNFSEVKQQCENYIDRLTETLYSMNPDLEKSMSKSEFKKSSMRTVTEKDLLEGMVNTVTSPFCFFGKVITGGMQDTYTNTMGLKIKRKYYVRDKGFSIGGQIDMSKDEIKEFVLKKVEETKPAEYQQVKDNIDQLLSLGMLKLDASEADSINLFDSGWMRSLYAHMSMTISGQKTDIDTHMFFKNW